MTHHHTSKNKIEQQSSFLSSSKKHRTMKKQGFRKQGFKKQGFRKRGFSFIEVMVVILILGLLSGIVGVYLFDAAEKAKVDATKTQIKSFATSLDLYRLHNSQYPSTEQGLQSLLSKPEVGIIPRNWNGPYLRGKKLPQDAWGSPFRYIGNGSEYQIISMGADAVEGGSDLNADINSDDL